MKDLKIDDWVTWAWSVFTPGVTVPTKTPALLPVAEAFAKNLIRCVGLANFPTSLFFAGRRVQLAHAAACWELLGKPHPDKSDAGRRAEIAQLAEQYLACKVAAPFRLDLSGDVEQAYRFATEDAKPLFEPLMSMQVVAAWTALETLPGDLWEAAVNCHPQGLAQLAGKRQKRDKKEGEKEKPDQGRMMTFSLLEKHQFNVGSVMGSIQRGMEKVAFNTLDKARSAYVAAFADELPAAYKILDEDAFFNLSVVRNVIVHNAGRCDKDYQSKAEGKPFLPQLEIGEELGLDGIFVRDLIDPVRKGCIRLIQTIDGWLDGRLSPLQGGGGI